MSQQPTSIKGMIQGITDKGMPTVVKGVVTSVSPLKIVLKDDIGINLSEASLLYSKELLPFKQGEELFLLAINNQKLYYILGPVEKSNNGRDRDKAKEEWEQYQKCKNCPYC